MTAATNPHATHRRLTRSVRAVAAAIAVLALAIAACGLDRGRSAPDLPVPTVPGLGGDASDGALVTPIDLGAADDNEPGESGGAGGSQDGDGGSVDDGQADDDDGGTNDDDDDAADDDGGTDGTSPDDDPSPDPVMPTCDDVLATGARLAVGPEPVVLEPGDMVGTLSIVNCGDATVDWFAATVPDVTLEDPAGSIEPGVTAELAFTIDGSAYDPGPIEFTLKVSEPNHNHYVDVLARRITTLDPDADELAPAPGTTTCDDGCIVSATFAKNLANTSVTVDVVTDLPTAVNAYVLDHEPILANDEPVVIGLDPTVTSAGPAVVHAPTLEGLAPATSYWVIVEALDAFGGAQRVWGAFETVTPPGDDPQVDAGGGPSGCATSCVTTALLEPDGSMTAVHVETHTPAHLRLWVSETPFPVDDDEQLIPPAFDTALADSGELETTNWDTAVELPFATDLHVLVRAQDLNGNSSYQSGTYHTHDAPQVRATFRTVTVHDDADSDSAGELRFISGYDDTVVDTTDDTASIESGTTIALDSSFTFTHGDVWPSFKVAATEFDDMEIVESCMYIWETMWTGATHLESCGYTINVAGGGINLGMTLESLPTCESLGLGEWGDERCMVLESPDAGDDYPVVSAVVTFEWA